MEETASCVVRAGMVACATSTESLRMPVERNALLHSVHAAQDLGDGRGNDGRVARAAERRPGERFPIGCEGGIE